jgi:hypothetical protein
MRIKRTEMRYYDRNFAWLAHTVQKPELCVPLLISNFISTSNSCGFLHGIWDLGLNSMNHYSPANFNLRQSEEKSLQNSRVNSSIKTCWSFKLKPYFICARHSKNWGKKTLLNQRSKCWVTLLYCKCKIWNYVYGSYVEYVSYWFSSTQGIPLS